MYYSSMMRKFISGILLILVMCSSGGYYLWFSLLQKSIQHSVNNEIEKGLEEADLTVIVVPVNDESGICWIRNGKEFRFKGEMFDVVKSRIVGENRHYYCVNDHKEKQLIADFSRSDHSKRESEKKIRLIFNYQWYPQLSLQQINLARTVILYPARDIHFISNQADIPSPPPRTS